MLFHFVFKAVQKIRDFLLQKIYQFRRPMTNYQIPQNALLKFRYSNLNFCVLCLFSLPYNHPVTTVFNSLFLSCS